MAKFNFIWGEHVFHNTGELWEFFADYEDDTLPEEVHYCKALPNSPVIHVDLLVDHLFEELDQGNYGGDKLCPEDDGFSSIVTHDETVLLKGLITLWFDALQFKMYEEDMTKEPYPLREKLSAVRKDRAERELSEAKRAGAQAVEIFLMEHKQHKHE